MNHAASVDDGEPILCAQCGTSSVIQVSRPPADALCPTCGAVLWVPALVEKMRSTGFVPDVQVPRLGATNRDDAIRELAANLAHVRQWTEQQQGSLEQALLEREALTTTGIGKGIAIPHTKLNWLEESVTALACSPEGIAFDAWDDLPIHAIVLIVSPKSQPEEHVRLLETVVRSLRACGVWRV